MEEEVGTEEWIKEDLEKRNEETNASDERRTMGREKYDQQKAVHSVVR